MTKPVITTTANTITVPLDTVVDKQYQIDNNGLVVIDDVDGNITSGTQTTVSTVVTSVAGSVTQTITATDLAGNVQTKTINITVSPALQTRANQSKPKQKSAKVSK